MILPARVAVIPPSGGAGLVMIPAVQPHGTVTRYDDGPCRCDQCRAANAARHREARARRRKQLAERFDQLEHGTRSTRVNYGCTCGPCLEAQREWNAARYRRHEPINPQDGTEGRTGDTDEASVT